MAKKITLNEIPNGRSAADIIGEIRRLYFTTTPGTIDRDFDRAIDLLKSIHLPQDRQRATVYMAGLAEMRKEWRGKNRRRQP